MDTDLALTVGIVLLVLSVPSLLAAWVESRAPRMGAIMAVGAGGQRIDPRDADPPVAMPSTRFPAS
jgi:hypothetical protein